MARRISKKMVVMLFCCFRQAERSLHYALSCPNKWPQFVEYYDQIKQARIRKAISLLRSAGAGQTSVPNRQDLEHSPVVSAIGSVMGFLLNQVRNSWSFSVAELSFFCRTLERVLMMLRPAEVPSAEVLIDCRMDCYQCQYVIARRLIGIPEIRKAQSIEHWFQSDHVEHVTFQELGMLGDELMEKMEPHAEHD